METFNPLTTNVPHHIETSQLICSANQLTGFYMMRTLVVNGLMQVMCDHLKMISINSSYMLNNRPDQHDFNRSVYQKCFFEIIPSKFSFSGIWMFSTSHDRVLFLTN